MTKKEARDALERLFHDSTDEEYWQTDEFAEAIGTAMAVLEKEIPQAVSKTGMKFKCPSCEKWLSKIYKHCPHCGQRLEEEA